MQLNKIYEFLLEFGEKLCNEDIVRAAKLLKPYRDLDTDIVLYKPEFDIGDYFYKIVFDNNIGAYKIKEYMIFSINLFEKYSIYETITYGINRYIVGDRIEFTQDELHKTPIYTSKEEAEKALMEIKERGIDVS